MNPHLTQQEENLQKVDAIKLLSVDLTKQIELIQQEYIQLQFAQERKEDELHRKLEATKAALDSMTQKYNKLLEEYRGLENLLESIHKQSRKKGTNSAPEHYESWD